jgi:predicted glutamate--cysteine ligase
MWDNTGKLLLKGIEEEGYTGTREGDAVGMSHEIAADLQGFATEPDCRNAEFATRPVHAYEALGHALHSNRRRLRGYLQQRGDYTLLPGASLTLGNAKVFMRSNPNNPYHTYIEEQYGPNVVTASEHINIGIAGHEKLIRAYRVIRAEAAVFLALSAASPFLDGKVTGYHSYRWHVFPKTPSTVPFFRNHAHYVEWVEAQLASGAMQNIRHLWLSARPNGIRAPQEIQRLELRVCDRVDSLMELMAIIAFAEARVHEVLADATLDPLRNGLRDDATLMQWTAANEEACSMHSLDAEVVRWDSGQKIQVRDWVGEMLSSARHTARELEFESYLGPLDDLLTNGNAAMRWLRLHADGVTIPDIFKAAIAETDKNEKEIVF